MDLAQLPIGLCRRLECWYNLMQTGFFGSSLHGTLHVTPMMALKMTDVKMQNMKLTD